MPPPCLNITGTFRRQDENMKLDKLILCIAAALMLLTACGDGKERTDAFYSRLKSQNKIVLAQMSISKMATVDDLDLSEARGPRQIGEALLDAVKIGDRKAAYSYSTFLRAYVDMSSFTPEDVSVDERDKTVEILLPPLRTEFIGRQPTIREDHYRVTGLRSQIDARERADIKEKMNASLKKEVEDDPVFRETVIDAARTKGIAWFSRLAARDGYTVTVKFRE